MVAAAQPKGPTAPPLPKAPREVAREGPSAEGEEADEPLEDRLARVTAAISRAAGLRLEGRFELGREAALLSLEASEPGFFLGEDGEGRTFEHLEQLLHRMFAPDVHPLKLRIELLGHRDSRDLALRRRTLALVDEVKADGQPRETAPLNAYERRIVHLAVATAGGVASRSEGEGSNRRVVISRSGDPGPRGEVL
jgi:spoIIIJ-associated protein